MLNHLTSSKYWLGPSALIVLAALAGPLAAQRAKQPTNRPAVQPTTQPAAKAKPLIRVIPEPNNKLNDLLKQKVKFNMKDVKFEDIISEYFQDVFKLNVVVNWSAMEMSRADIKEVPINANLKDISLRKVLNTVLALAGDGEVELGYFEKDGVIHVNTLENINTRMTTRIYDCTELLASCFFPDTNYTLLFPITEITLPKQKRKEIEYFGLYQGKRILHTETAQQRYLARLVADNVDQDSWGRNGGTAQMQWFGTSLVIKNTYPNQADVLTLLQNLRKMQIQKQELQPIVVRAWWIPGSSPAWMELKTKMKKDASLKLTAETLSAIAPNSQATGRGYNRSPMQLADGKGTLLVTGKTVLKTKDDLSASLETQNIFFGKMLRITATLRKKNKEAMVDIDSLASSLRQAAQKPYKDKDSNVKIAIDHPTYLVGELKTQTAIPVGKPLLIGGFTMKPQGNAASKTPAEPSMLFLQIDVPKSLDK